MEGMMSLALDWIWSRGAHPIVADPITPPSSHTPPSRSEGISMPCPDPSAQINRGMVHKDQAPSWPPHLSERPKARWMQPASPDPTLVQDSSSGP